MGIFTDIIDKKNKKFTWSQDKKRPVKYSKALQKLIDNFKKNLLGSGVKLEVMRLNDPQGKTPLIRVRHSTIKDGVATIKGTQNFNLTPDGFKEAKKYAEGMKADPKNYPRTDPQKGGRVLKEAEEAYSKLRKQWTQEAIDFIEEATSSGKYKTVEEVNKALMKKFSDPKYSYKGLPKSVRKTTAFVRPDKYPGQLMFDYDYVFPKDSGLEGIQMKDRAYKGKAAQRDLILKGFLNNSTDKINPKFKNLSNSLFTFFTDPPKGEPKPLLSTKNEEELKRFSKKYNLQGAKAGTERGGSLLANYLFNRGLDFNKYKISNERAFGRATILELKRELKRPDITPTRRAQLENTIEALRKFDRGFRRRLYKKYPSLFKKSKGGQSIVFEHLVARSVPEATGEVFQSFERLPYDYRMRGRFVPAYFNKEKLTIFDKPLIDLIDQYESAPDASTRKSIETDIKKLKKEFNDATKVKGKGYADNLDISFKGNRVVLKDKTPVFKTGVSDFDLKKDILKNIEHSNKLFTNLGKKEYVYKGSDFNLFKKDTDLVKMAIAKLSTNKVCAVGGRKPMNTGGNVSGLDQCFREGLDALKKRNINKPHQIQGAKQLMNSGKKIGTNKFVNILANLGVVGEVAFIAGDIGVRQAMGRPFYEAFLAATFRDNKADLLRRERAGGASKELQEAERLDKEIFSLNQQIDSIDALGDFYGQADKDALIKRRDKLLEEYKPYRQYMTSGSIKNISDRVRTANVIDSDRAKSLTSKLQLRDNLYGIPNIADYGEIDAGTSQPRPKERSVLPSSQQAMIDNTRRELKRMKIDESQISDKVISDYINNQFTAQERMQAELDEVNREEQVLGFNPDKSLEIPSLLPKGTYIPRPGEEKELLEYMSKVQGAKDGGLMNLTRTTPPKRSLNKDSQGLASLPEYDR